MREQTVLLSDCFCERDTSFPLSWSGLALRVGHKYSDDSCSIEEKLRSWILESKSQFDKNTISKIKQIHWLVDGFQYYPVPGSALLPPPAAIAAAFHGPQHSPPEPLQAAQLLREFLQGRVKQGGRHPSSIINYSSSIIHHRLSIIHHHQSSIIQPFHPLLSVSLLLYFSCKPFYQARESGLQQAFVCLCIPRWLDQLLQLQTCLFLSER